MPSDTEQFVLSHLRKSFRGGLSSVRVEPVSHEKLSLDDVIESKDPVDFEDMARGGLHYLTGNPRPEYDYQPVFHVFGLSCPPVPDGPDIISDGDTDSRMDWEHMYMRDIYPTMEGADVQNAIRKRVLGYLGEDGLCQCSAAALYLPPDVVAASPWTTGKLLVSMAESYLRTGEISDLQTARKCFLGLKSLASWKGKLAYYSGGLSAWTHSQGWLTGGAFSTYDVPICQPCMRYWEVSNDDEALDFAIAFADGVLSNGMGARGRVMDWTGNEIFDPSFQEDGSFVGHVHMHSLVAWGVAEVGRITGEKRFIDFSQRVCDFLVRAGTDYGWTPEYMWEMFDSSHSETCAASDLVSLATCLARSSSPDYWDIVERSIRNYFNAIRFFVTDEYVDMYRRMHSNLPKEKVEAGLETMRRMEGGFMGSIKPNDMDIGPASELRLGLDMMGCCVPEGMRAVHTTWRHVVTEDAGEVFVNMSFNRDHESAQVISCMPTEGRLVVKSKKAGNYNLRPPSMVPPQLIEARRNGIGVPVMWSGNYARFEHVKLGEQMEILYPLISFGQAIKVGVGEWERDYNISWKGSTVTGVKPEGESWPIFRQETA